MEKNNGFKRVLYNVIFPAILFMYPLIGISEGADIGDTTYSLGNYMFFDSMAGSWKYATFLANLTGYGLLKLAGGKMFVMNGLTSLFISAIALTVFYVLRKRINVMILFIGEIIAICLCWCPSVILYNYMTYLFFTMGALLLYKALTTDSRRYYVLAGLSLGINLFVRISNAIEVLLILALVYAFAIAREKIKFWISFGLCVLGYVIGAGAGLLIMIITGGSSGFKKAIEWMLSLTSSGDNNGGYDLKTMVKVIVDNYLGNVKWFIVTVVAIGLGVLVFKMLKGRILVLSKIGFALCVCILMYAYYRVGLISRDFYSNYCMFRFLAIIDMLMICVYIYAIVSKHYIYEDKILAVIALLIILITPLGSNNHLFTIINSMFIVLPVAMHLCIMGFDGVSNCPEVFAVKAVCLGLITVMFICSLCFNMCYVFQDSLKGEARNTAIKLSSTMSGMKTNEKHAKALDELTQYMAGKRESDLMLYGNIPGVAYMLEMNVCIDTLWPDLDSYSYKDFDKQLNMLSDKNDTPVIIISTEDFYDMSDSDSDKDKSLVQFILDNNYVKDYYNDEFVVLCVN